MIFQGSKFHTCISFSDCSAKPYRVTEILGALNKDKILWLETID